MKKRYDLEIASNGSTINEWNFGFFEKFANLVGNEFDETKYIEFENDKFIFRFRKDYLKNKFIQKFLERNKCKRVNY